MDPLNILLARIQFAVCVGFHYLWPPMTIGMSWLIFFMMTKYKTTKDQRWGQMAHFWTKIFALGFAVGVATGIVMEFSFGTNWANYSRFVGDIFGAPLAAEGVFAFFLESSFLGVMLFGWKRFKLNTHWFASMMVAVGSTMSAFWIIVANSWQQTPAGAHLVKLGTNGKVTMTLEKAKDFVMNQGGSLDGWRAEMTSFTEAVFNASTIPRFLHVITGAMLVGSFFMMGIAAWYLLKSKKEEHKDFAQRTFSLALVTACVFSLVQLTMGHWQAVRVWETQPAKLAAIEGIFETQKPANLSLFGWPDAKAEKTHMEIGIPGGLSLLLNASLDTEVKGLKEFPKEQWPPLAWTFVPYHLMIGLGTFFIALTLLGVFLLLRKKLFEAKWYITLVYFTFPLVFVADHSGWIAAEVGRQPWIVWGLQRTSEAASPSVSTMELVFSLIMFCAIYTLLGGAWFYLLRQKLNRGPEPFEGHQAEEVKA